MLTEKTPINNGNYSVVSLYLFQAGILFSYITGLAGDTIAP